MGARTMGTSADPEELEYEDMMVLSFGLMDPCEWAADLGARLLAASETLAAARAHYLDPTKDIDETTDEEALSAIRAGVSQYISEAFTMLHSMPMMQQQPVILEALQFIVAGIANVDRGTAPAWLVPCPTKRHHKQLAEEAEWVPIIAALELILLKLEKRNVDKATKLIAERTKRKVGTIKDWHQHLYCAAGPERQEARASIQSQIDDILYATMTMPKERRSAIIQRRVDELIA
jgi:hypothetical protein